MFQSRRTLPGRFAHWVVLALLLLLRANTWAQDSPPATGTPDRAPSQLGDVQTGNVPRLIQFSGSLRDPLGNPLTGTQGITLSLYKEQKDGPPLWMENQNVVADEQGRYAVMLGAATKDGLPLDMFTSAESRWLGVQSQLPGELEQARILLVSVPYALKAADAETLGGKPLSSFVLTMDGGVDQSSPPKAAASDKLPTAATTTQDQVAKYVNGSGTLGDSAITETSGKVGIGITTPGRDLHIKSSGGAKVRLEDSTIGSSFWELQQSAWNNDYFGIVRYESGSAVQSKSSVVSSSGYVGIGTGSPGRPLHIKSSAPVIRLEDTNYANSFWELQQSAFYNDYFGFVRYESGSAVESKSMVISSGGNMGVGTGSPTEKLEVAGNVKITGTNNGITFPDATILTSANPALIRGITFVAGCDWCGVLDNSYDQPKIYFNVVGAMTINSVTCFSDTGTPVINIGKNGSNILSSNLTCSTSGATTTGFSSSALSLNDSLDFVMVTAGGAAHRVTIAIKASVN